jgi:hypothetical protein
VPEVNIIVKAKDEASRTLRGIGDNLGGLNMGLAALGGVGVAAIGTATYALADMAWQAAKLEPTRITFENLSKSIGTTADSLLNQLKPATMGVVAEADLMLAANKFLAMGLADTEQETAKLAEMAVTLGIAMGKDATVAMEEFALMMANQSIPRLDTFGISAGIVRERINELMEATEGMTREEAFTIAVMEQGEEAMKKVGDVSDTTAVKIAGVEAKWKDFKLELGEAILTALEPLIDEIFPVLIQLLDDLTPLIGEVMPEAVRWATMSLLGWGKAIALVSVGMQIFLGLINSAIEAWYELGNIIPVEARTMMAFTPGMGWATRGVSTTSL